MSSNDETAMSSADPDGMNEQARGTATQRHARPSAPNYGTHLFLLNLQLV